MIKKYHVSKNLAPPMSDGWVDGYVNASTGGITQPTAANEKTSDYIDVHQYSYVSNCYENGDFPSRGTSTSTTAWYGLGCYREDKSFISCLINNLTYQLPAGTYYVRMCFRTFDETGNVMVNGGDTQLPYEPYGNTWHSIPYRKYGTETDTLTSFPADVIADGQSASATIIGNMQQTGTPSPSSIIMPSECGDKTENLCDESTVQNGYFGQVSPYQFVSDVKYRCVKVFLKAGTYTIKAVMDNNTIVILRASSNSLGSNVIYDNTRTTITLSVDEDVFISMRNVDTTNDFTGFKLMLNTGETALPYEPYGYKLDIKSGNTTTPVYLGEVQSTRKIKKLVVDGTENWNEETSNYYIFINVSGRGEGIPNSAALCTHTGNGVVVNNNGTALFFKKSEFVHSTLADFKTYLQQQYSAGTPVTVWYVLATPTTGIVNEPIRKIGDYADNVSVTNIPTTAGGIEFDVLTTLKPSEVDLTYHGWHRKEPKERINGDWE